MNILELAILKKMVGGGGGSGTDNYNDLSNLPQINGETLAGNKTAENLGLQDALTFDSAPTEDSTNPVESGGVYNALAGKQDNLTFDDDPTENSTNPVKSGGVYNALAGKQDNLTFDGVYNASTNKAATESTVANAIAGLDVSDLSVDADETISSISETDGKISVTKQDIAIASNQVVSMAGYTKPSSAPATPAIQQGDTANAAFGKLEYKADVNQTNILYTLNRTGKNLAKELPTQTVNGVKLTNNGDGTYTITRTAQGSGSTSFVFGSNEDGKFDGYILTGGAVGYGLKAKTSLDDSTAVVSSNDWTTPKTIPSTARGVISVVVDQGENPQNVVIRPFICDAEMYAKDPSFTIPALPNYDLTYLQAQDRAALAEEIDAGAKNLLYTPTVTISNITWTVDSNSYITASPNNSDSRFYLYSNRQYTVHLKPGSYVLALDIKTATASNIANVSLLNTSDTKVANVINTQISGKTGIVYSEFTITAEGDYGLIAKVYDMVCRIMLCTKAAFGVSNKFVPYRFQINGKMWVEKYETRSTTLTTTGIKFVAPKQTIYRITATAFYGSGKPTKLVIKKKLIPSETEGDFVSVTSDNDSQSLTATGVMTLGVGGYFEVYVSYENATSNRVYAIVEEVVI